MDTHHKVYFTELVQEIYITNSNKKKTITLIIRRKLVRKGEEIRFIE